MSGDVLDVVLLLAVVVFAFSGYRQGLLVGVLSFAGFVGGGLLGMRVATAFARSVADATTRPVVALAVVIVAAVLGKALATRLGWAIRQRLTWRPARALDSAGGATISAGSVLLAAWLIGSLVVTSPFPGLVRQVRQSRVLTGVDAVMPMAARTWFSSFRQLVDRQGFPEVFGRIGAPSVAPAAPPDAAVLSSRAVQAARDDVVKITGSARSCSRQLEGSGFVYATDRVMTNAHVVAGVTAPRVEVARRTLPARVVLFDADRDVAVLAVAGLGRPPLAFAGIAAGNDSAVVAGYPQGGPFTAVPARIRSRQSVRGPNIRQDRTVTREVYAVRALVQPGNSGGPLLAADGTVYGVVFAAAVDDPETGYALTAAEVAPDARAGTSATESADTGGCD
jgi:S1-C subfamily serine protease